MLTCYPLHACTRAEGGRDMEPLPFVHRRKATYTERAWIDNGYQSGLSDRIIQLPIHCSCTTVYP